MKLFKTKKYKDELKEMYLTGFSIPELAIHYGYSKCGIRYQLKKLGILKFINKKSIKKTENITTIDTKEIIKEYKNNVPIKDIIKKYNLSLNTFKDIFKNHLLEQNKPKKIKEIKEVIEPNIILTKEPLFDVPFKIKSNNKTDESIISIILDLIGKNLNEFSNVNISRKDGILNISIKEK
jgi:hypothetical protein